MEEKQTKSKKVEQRAFSVMDMRKYNVKYGADKICRWIEIRGKKKKKKYPMIDIFKVKITKDYIVREDILEQSRLQYEESKELIPVLLSPDNELINGYEQYLLAKELKRKRIPFYPQKLSKSEKLKRKKAKAVKRRAFTRAEREAVFKKCNGKCSRCGKKLQIDDYRKKDTYMTIDHIKRISSGGTYDISNLTGLCNYCHQCKDNQGKLKRGKNGKKKRMPYIPQSKSKKKKRKNTQNQGEKSN